jgi:hypothetical protein
MADRVKYFRFKLGCDPEMFLADVQGQLKSSCGKIGGSKIQPQPLPMLGDGYAVQEDNVAIEFNIPAAETARDFVDSISRTIKVLGDGVNASLGFHLDRRSAALFPKEELESEAARVFGCDPDYNAWTGKVNPKPKADDETLRSCGGHVHVGFDKGKIGGRRLMKMMDLFLGVPSVIMDEGDLRKQLYGKAGAYREKDYGFEYRVLSNFWIWNPKLVKWVWDQSARAIDWTVSPMDIDSEKEAIVSAINNNDKNAAMALVKKYNLEVMSV